MITNTNLFSGAYDLVKEFLRNNITDPRNRNRKQWIHASMPNITAQGFEGYPFIVLTAELLDRSQTFSNESSKEYRILISIYSDEPTEVDSISDEIISKLREIEEIKVISVGSSPISSSVIGGRKIITRKIGLIGRVRV